MVYDAVAGSRTLLVYLIMENDVISKFIWNVDLHFCTALWVGVQHSLGWIDEFQAVVEEDGADERKRFELLEGSGLFQQLPFRIAGVEFLDELVRIRQEVVLIVLVADLVSLLFDWSRRLVLQILV